MIIALSAVPRSALVPFDDDNDHYKNRTNTLKWSVFTFKEKENGSNPQ